MALQEREIYKRCTIGYHCYPMDGDKPQDGIPVSDAIELLQNLTTAPVAGNLNAEQIEELKKLSVEDWQRLWNEYHVWQKAMRFGLARYWLLIIVASGFSYWYWQIEWAALGVILGCYVLVKRAGQDQGYGQGYEAGLESGVNRALGLTDEESYKISELASEAQLWGRIDTDKIRRKANDKSHSSPPPVPPQP